MSDELGQTCRNWWHQLTSVSTGQNRADLARLRRADGVVAVLMIAAVHDLNDRLKATRHDLRQQPDRLALIALSLAQIKTETRQTVARRMGQGGPPALSGIRFNALIRAREPQTLITPLRRALRVTGHVGNVALLSTDLYWWSDTTRARWCFDYYGAEAPDTLEETPA